MSSVFENDTDPFHTLVNHEGQYALWPALWPARWAVPAGWQAVGGSGARADCLARIEAAWTDLRPRSLAARSQNRGSRTAAAEA